MARRRRRPSTDKGVFDPDDIQNVKYTRLGIWHIYEQRNPPLKYIPSFTRLEPYLEALAAFPYVWRMVKDLGSVSSFRPLLCIYLSVSFIASLVPALSLWYIIPYLPSCHING